MSKNDKILQTRMKTEPNPRLDDLLNRKNLDRHLSNGIVKCATHDKLPLYLYDYTTRCERAGKWDGVTIQTRGLIRDNKGLIVARPMQKFFSHGGKSTSAVQAPRWTDYWYGTHKMDGTMIVAANFNDELVLSTRGSFDAWQIQAAKACWRGEIPPVGETWIFEYVGPDNKIVIDYEYSLLVLLTVINNWTGEEDADRYLAVSSEANWRTPKRYEAETVDELKAQEKNDGMTEGFVVVWPRQGKHPLRMKLKYPAYNLRHMEVFGKMNP